MYWGGVADRIRMLRGRGAGAAAQAFMAWPGNAVKYVSTRGMAPTLGFSDVLLSGLASDGGLYVPESWPSLPADDVLARGRHVRRHGCRRDPAVRR